MNGFSSCVEVKGAPLWCQSYSTPKHSCVTATMDSQSSICGMLLLCMRVFTKQFYKIITVCMNSKNASFNDRCYLNCSWESNFSC